MTYDDAGRLLTQTLPTGQLTYTYDAEGKRTTVRAPDGTTVSASYDAASRLTAITWAGLVSGSVARTYDAVSRLVSQSVDGDTIPFTYDHDNRLTGAGALTLTRDAQTGQIVSSTLDSITDTRNYNAADELLTYQASTNGAGLWSTEYIRDQVGRVTQKTETVGGVTDTYTYTYDPAGRLTAVQKNGGTIATYTYDANSNRLAHTTPTGAVTGTYDEQDRLLSYGGTTYTYTANGELQSRTVKGQTTQYTYDVLGNLLRVDLPEGTQIDYIIDGENRRLGKKVNGTLAQGFLYQDQLEPVAELDGSGNVVARFVYGCKQNVPDYLLKGGVTYRILSDHLGSPRLVVDTTTGAIVQRMDYDEFGNVILDTNPGFQPFGFAGGIYDQHTKLVRFGARDYDAETGRWTAKDPIRFRGGLSNLYGYVLNDPVNFTDPSGLQFYEVVTPNTSTLGREGTVINPKSSFSLFLQRDVSHMYAFAVAHDQLVGTLTDLGIPDPIVNIPTMLPTFLIKAFENNLTEERPPGVPTWGLFTILEIRLPPK
jgi:RHS repeat-associated protein